MRAAGRTEDAVVTDFGSAFGQDVLKKSVNEVRGGKHDVANALSLVVAVAETDDAVVERFQAAVGNGDPKNVASKIVEHFVATTGVLRMNDPANLPDRRGSELK